MMMTRTVRICAVGMVATIVIVALTIALERRSSIMIPSSSLEITPSIIDMGTLEPGETASAQCVLRNVGDHALTIERIIAQCACTAATAGGSRLAPGESTVLNIRLNSEGYMRRLQKAIVIETDAVNSNGIVVVQAYVKVGVRANSSELLFESILPGDTITRTIEVYYDQGQNIGNVRVEGLPEGCMASVDKPERCEGIIVQRIHVSMTAPLKVSGWYQTAAHVRIGDAVILPLQIRYEVRPAVRCDPESVDIPATDIPITMNVACSERYSLKTISVESIYGRMVPLAQIRGQHSAVVQIRRGTDATGREDMDVLSVDVVITDEDGHDVRDRVAVPVRIQPRLPSEAG